jgi:hypothetical protein
MSRAIARTAQLQVQFLGSETRNGGGREGPKTGFLALHKRDIRVSSSRYSEGGKAQRISKLSEFFGVETPLLGSAGEAAFGSPARDQPGIQYPVQKGRNVMGNQQLRAILKSGYSDSGSAEGLNSAVGDRESLRRVEISSSLQSPG